MLARRRTAGPRLELLEDRACPATVASDLNNNVTVTLTPLAGPLTLALTGTDTINITGNGIVGPVPSIPVNNLIINGTAVADTVTFDLVGDTMNGNLTFNGGSANDTFQFIGTPGTLGGNVVLSKVNTLTSFAPATTVIGGSVIVNNAGENVLTNFDATGIEIGGSVCAITGNLNDVFDIVDSFVGGSVKLNLGNGSNQSDLSSTDIGGNLTFCTGSGDDVLTMDEGTVGGVTNIKLGTAITSNTVEITNSILQGVVCVYGGARGDNVTLTSNTFDTGVRLSLGSGQNIALLDDNIFNSTAGFLSYTGGAGQDALTYTPNAGSERIRISALFGAGDDTLTITAPATAAPSFVYADFGAGADTILGTVNYPFKFRNLP